MRILFILTAAALFAVGIIMIFSTTSAEALDLDLENQLNLAVMKQVFYAVSGVIFAALLYHAGHHRLLRWSPYLLALFTFFLFLVLIPGIGREVNGSRRWLSLAGFSLQPSEFVKILIPAYFIRLVTKSPQIVASFKGFLKLISIIAVPMFLILVEPNNGTVAVIGVTLVVLCGLMQVPPKYWALPLLVMALLGSVSALQLPYVTSRLKVYLNPELDLRGKGHQPHQAKIAAGSGKIFGKGPGNSLQKLSYLPEAQNDYIAAIYAEEFGFFGVVALITLYMTMAFLGFTFASEAKTHEGFYLAASLTFLFSFQGFLNLGVVSGILPSTGLNLPLFSQGGSSLIANCGVLGILLDVSRKQLTVKL